MSFATRVSEIQTRFSSTVDGLFIPSQDWLSNQLNRIWTAGLFLIGLVQWGMFLNWGRIPFDLADWYDITWPRLEFLRNALTTGQLPLHMAASSATKEVTDRFLSLPDLILLPHVALLRWLEPGPFSLLHVLLLFSAGFTGLLLIKKRFHLGIIPFTILFFLSNFNGNISAHLSVGHLTWASSFLFPYFVLLVFELLETGKQVRWDRILKIAALQGVIFLAGGFHQFVWGLLFLGLIGIFHRQYFKQVAAAVGFSLLISMVRILPIAIESGRFQYDFLSGFMTLREMIDGLTLVVPIDQVLRSVTKVTPLTAWWEYDFYIGMVGLAFLIWFVLESWRKKDHADRIYPQLAWPCLAMMVLSVGRIYRVIFLIHVPLLNAERITSRFLIIPLFFFFVIAVVGLQQALSRNTRQPVLRGLSIAGLLVLINDLQQHQELWKVEYLNTIFAPEINDPARALVMNHPDPLYFAALMVGSILTVVCVVVLLRLRLR